MQVIKGSAILDIMKNEYEMVAHVNVKGEWIPEDLIEFLDIGEDLQGYDIMTFKYQGQEYRSRITQRPR